MSTPETNREGGGPHTRKPMDSRPPWGGWAPGNYYNKCCHCDCRFIGDKRAMTCADCAYEQKAKSESENREGGEQVKAKWIISDAVEKDRAWIGRPTSISMACGKRKYIEEIADALNKSPNETLLERIEELKDELDIAKEKAAWVDKWFPIIDKDVREFGSYHVSAVKAAIDDIRALLTRQPK